MVKNLAAKMGLPADKIAEMLAQHLPQAIDKVTPDGKDQLIQFWFKAAFLEEAAFSRGDRTDAEWRILNPLLPDRGERGPAVPDKPPILPYSAPRVARKLKKMAWGGCVVKECQCRGTHLERKEPDSKPFCTRTKKVILDRASNSWSFYAGNLGPRRPVYACADFQQMIEGRLVIGQQDSCAWRVAVAKKLVCSISSLGIRNSLEARAIIGLPLP
jgi:YidB-like protein